MNIAAIAGPAMKPLMGETLVAQVGQVLPSKDFTNRRTRPNGYVNESRKVKNRDKSWIRSRVGYVFGLNEVGSQLAESTAYRRRTTP